MEHQTLDLSKFGTATAYCAAMGISAATLYRLLQRGEGPETVRVSKNCRLFRLPADDKRMARAAQ